MDSVAYLNGMLASTERTFLRLSYVGMLILGGAAALVLIYQAWTFGWLVLLSAAAGLALGGRAIFGQNKLIRGGLTVRARMPWTVSIREASLVVTAGGVSCEHGLDAFAKAEYFIADDEEAGRALCGCLKLTLMDGRGLRIPDSSAGFDEVFRAVAARTPIIRVDVSNM